MNRPGSSFIHPTERELVTACQTLYFNRDPGTIHARLAAASAMLQSLDQQPAETSLVFARSNDAPIEFMPAGNGITVGRGRDCNIRLSNCADLSRHHFRVRPVADVWLVEDLGSRNGTTVDGVNVRISRHLLRDGDFILAGELTFLFVNPTG